MSQHPPKMATGLMKRTLGRDDLLEERRLIADSRSASSCPTVDPF